MEARNTGILSTASPPHPERYPNPYHRHTVKPGSREPPLSPLSLPTLPPQGLTQPLPHCSDLSVYVNIFERQTVL